MCLDFDSQVCRFGTSNAAATSMASRPARNSPFQTIQRPNASKFPGLYTFSLPLTSCVSLPQACRFDCRHNIDPAATSSPTSHQPTTNHQPPTTNHQLATCCACCDTTREAGLPSGSSLAPGWRVTRPGNRMVRFARIVPRAQYAADHLYIFSGLTCLPYALPV